MRRELNLTINDRPTVVEIEPHWTLLELLHDHLDFIGTKNGCSQGVCGACTLLVDGRAVRACLSLAAAMRGKRITTVEGLKRNGTLHRLQQAFADAGAVQCGFCTPGMLMASAALLEEHPHPSEPEVREALVGNLCRCTGYARIVRAVLRASQSQDG